MVKVGDYVRGKIEGLGAVEGVVAYVTRLGPVVGATYFRFTWDPDGTSRDFANYEVVSDRPLFGRNENGDTKVADFVDPSALARADMLAAGFVDLSKVHGTEVSEHSLYEDRITALPAKDTNPKTVYGQAKPSLGLVPGAALVHCAEALRDGSAKYGRANWRDDPVSVSTYYDATLRHMTQWLDGEGTDPASKVHHLGHAMANLAILLDAEAHGTLIDDRPPASKTAQLIRDLTRSLPSASRTD
ncbi:MAG: dATP/dGTP diphosphohydrolase domain-containing protein [Moraxellaceae bacterium]